MSEMTRAERWDWVQTMLPPSTKGYFERKHESFMKALPERAMSLEELARLAFYAGAHAAFYGLAEHEKRVIGWPTEDAITDLQALAMEPMEFMKRYGMGID